ncbi:efflux RND transporter periplasmic adaptor subunit [Qipengyuania sp. DGS5-3]|uniref:efflux RND transporter periplasmic adaptor subunit n=1 Tax=Qipengyuania sp. DGS5-3 TaxID=3349632 RepID=UPI0036D30E6A
MNYQSDVTAERADGFSTVVDGDARDDARSRIWRIAIGAMVLLLLAAIGVFAYQKFFGAATPAGDDEGQNPVVTVISPDAETVQGQISATGSIAARRELPVGVVGEGGRVVAVPVDAGEWVSQGQVLAVIDRSVQTQQAQSAQAQVRVAEADAELAQANLDRSLQLVDRGFVSAADVDRLTATRDAAAARVQVAKAQAAELRARNARLNIVAPAAGLVLERNVEPGQTASPASGPLFRIARGGEMELMAQVSEAEMASLSPGVAATVTPVGSAKSFTGQVWQISPTIDPQSRQGMARIALSYAPELRPGGFANATINSGTVVAPMLPESAILSDGDGSFVYVVSEDSKAERRPVKTGLVTSNGIVVTEGLDGSEQVVLRAGGFLTEGEAIVARAQEEG